MIHARGSCFSASNSNRTVLTRESSQGVFFPSFPLNTNLCPMETLRQYEAATTTLRSDACRLFVAIREPHKQVTSSTIACWLKEMLKLTVVDISIFSGHSVRGASTSAAAGAGVTMNEIMQAADWNMESVFQKFYYWPSHNVSYGRIVLSSSDTGKT